MTPTDARTCSWCGCPIPGQGRPATGPGASTPPNPLADVRVPVEPVPADVLCIGDATGMQCAVHRRQMTVCRAVIRRLLLQGGI